MIELATDLKMSVQLTIIDELGIRMYGKLPPVLGELISNAYDADAENVWIRIDESPSNSYIEVRDDGNGMSRDEVKQKYLVIGRKKREEEGRDTSEHKGRPLQGRKGIGKLSGFGVAEVLEVCSVRDQRITHFVMNVNDIRGTIRHDETGAPKDYLPTKAPDDGKNADERNGTAVFLRSLKRKTPIDILELRRGIARRFSVLSTDFQVHINGDPIRPDERDLKVKCQFVWVTPGDLLGNGVLDEGRDWRVTGWIGTYPKPVSAGEGKGIVLMAKGKMAHEPSEFDVGQMEAQHAMEYMVGEIHAEFLDGAEDNIAPYRGSIIWESPEGETLRVWLWDAMRKVARDWRDKREKEMTKAITNTRGYDDWFAHLPARDQKVANKIVKVVAKANQDDPEKARALMHYVVTGFEVRTFVDLVDELSDLTPERAADVMKLFEEWRLIESREIYRVLSGRLAAIQALSKLVDTNAREVPDIHSFLAKNPWIIEPTWTVAYDEEHLTDILRKEFPEKVVTEKDLTRIDFVCIGVGDTVHLVELKRPSVSIGDEELAQIVRYKSWLEENLGTHPTHSYRFVRAYLIGGTLKAGTKRSLESVYEKAGVYYYPYSDLLSNAKKLHSEYTDVLEKFGAKRPGLELFAKDAALAEAEEAEGIVAAAPAAALVRRRTVATKLVRNKSTKTKTAKTRPLKKTRKR